MKGFILRISVFIIAILAVLKGMEMIISYGLKNSGGYYHSDIQKTRLGKMNKDLVILGSSRAFVQYDPNIISDSTGLDSYNLAVDGGCQTMQSAIWKNLIAHNSFPKVVIQNVEYLSFGKRKTLFEKERYLPYLEDPNFYKPLSQIDSSLWKDRYVPMFRYHGYWNLILDAADYYLGNPPRLPYKLKKGHQYRLQSFVGQEETNDFPLERADLILGKEILTKQVAECKANGALLILCYAPEFDNGKNPPNAALNEILNFYSALANENNNVEFWNYRNNAISKSKENFADNYHLNEKGARAFSKEFSHQLKVYLNNPN